MGERGVSSLFSIIMLIALTVVFMGVFAAWFLGFLPGPPDVVANVSLLKGGGSEPKIVVTFEHRGGEAIHLNNLAVKITWKDKGGTFRTSRSESNGSGVTVEMVTEPVQKPLFEVGDNLKLTFTLVGYSLDPSENVSVWLIYTPANQVLVHGEFKPE